jgi:hypothetical protein
MNVVAIPTPVNLGNFWSAIYTNRPKKHFQEKYCAVFVTEEFEGLGKFDVCGIEIDGIQCILSQYTDEKSATVVLDVPTNLSEPKVFVYRALAALGLDSSNGARVFESFMALNWGLWHIHGRQSVLIARYQSEESALQAATEWMNRNAKGKYVVRAAP